MCVCHRDNSPGSLNGNQTLHSHVHVPRGVPPVAFGALLPPLEMASSRCIPVSAAPDDLRNLCVLGGGILPLGAALVVVVGRSAPVGGRLALVLGAEHVVGVPVGDKPAPVDDRPALAADTLALADRPALGCRNIPGGSTLAAESLVPAQARSVSDVPRKPSVPLWADIRPASNQAAPLALESLDCHRRHVPDAGVHYSRSAPDCGRLGLGFVVGNTPALVPQGSRQVSRIALESVVRYCGQSGVAAGFGAAEPDGSSVAVVSDGDGTVVRQQLPAPPAHE